MNQYTRDFTYLDLKAELARWCDETEGLVYASDSMHHPFHPEQQSSVSLILWDLATSRNLSIGGLKYYFDRFVWAVTHRADH